MNKLSWFLLVLTVIIMVFGQVMSKQGASSESLLNVFVLMGYLALFIRGVIWIFVLKRLPISAAYPFMSLSFVLVLGAAYYFFGEKVTPFKILGSILIAAGTILTTIGNRQANREREEERSNEDSI